MRREPGHYLFPGNAIAARRQARKAPQIILWTIGIITCLLFAAAAALLAVGYLNPFGTIGLSILGVGAVLYFGAIIFLVLSCLWVERKYPGMQPLSFRIYSRKPQRPTPTVFMNPNVSGHIPTDTTQAFRIHDLPSNRTGSNDIERGNETEEDENEISEPGNSLDSDNVPTETESLEDDGLNLDDRSTVMKGKSQDQQEHLVNEISKANTDQLEKDFHHNEKGNRITPSVSPQMERKTQHKTHHIEIPPEDYPSSANSALNHNSTTQPQSQEASPQRKKSPEKNNLHTTGNLATVSSPEDKAPTPQPRKTKKSVTFETTSTNQKSTEDKAALVSQTQQKSSQPSNADKEKPVEKDRKAQDMLQITKRILSEGQETKQILARPGKNSHKNVTVDTQVDLSSLVKKLESPQRLQKMNLMDKANKLDPSDRGLKSRNDPQSFHSPTNIRNIAPPSSVPEHHHRSPSDSPKVSRTKDHSVTMTSPTRKRTRSPNVSPKVSPHKLSPRSTKEELHSKHHQSSPDSSDAASTPSSQTHDKRSPDISNKGKRLKDVSTENTRITPQIKKDGRHKRSSQSSDVSLSSTTSPVSAKEQTSTKSHHTRDKSTETSNDSGGKKH